MENYNGFNTRKFKRFLSKFINNEYIEKAARGEIIDEQIEQYTIAFEMSYTDDYTNYIFRIWVEISEKTNRSTIRINVNYMDPKERVGEFGLLHYRTGYEYTDLQIVKTDVKHIKDSITEMIFNFLTYYYKKVCS